MGLRVEGAGGAFDDSQTIRIKIISNQTRSHLGTKYPRILFALLSFRFDRLRIYAFFILYPHSTTLDQCHRQ